MDSLEATESFGDELVFSDEEDKVELHDILPPARFTAGKDDFKPEQSKNCFLN